MVKICHSFAIIETTKDLGFTVFFNSQIKEVLKKCHKTNMMLQQPYLSVLRRDSLLRGAEQKQQFLAAFCWQNAFAEHHGLEKMVSFFPRIVFLSSCALTVCVRRSVRPRNTKFHTYSIIAPIYITMLQSYQSKYVAVKMGHSLMALSLAQVP